MTRYPCAFIFSGKPHTMQFVQTNRSCFGPWSAPLFGRETHIVTVLLLDLGNTALKWTTLDKPEEPQTYVHGGHGTPPDELLRTLSALKPTRVVGCMVSSEMLALSLTKFFNAHGIPWEWLHSEPVFRGNFELTNGYENCRQLGSDRWFAAIGAASLYPGQSLLVVHMGTATTVDSVVSENGRLVFCGGRILPGPAMMYESLVKGTRCRPNGIGAVEPFPKNTDSAISTGILEAHLGVIEHAMAAMQDKGSDVKIVFAGGAAPLLAPYIRARFPQAVLKHNLVLRGLAQQASQQGLTA